ncbi:hypothetical protein CY0110_19527 [Crocosphaera chwakensis CCY0110]|uniref:Uncharacterized protein n=1 Tax=Crocosphaera chwakensis CCY0110 TaxID=391612 RepID=A3IJN7_9CHRO|nr:hypothetical protein CY0110_19527 [Crocosphaera chwakensis CCY0110]
MQVMIHNNSRMGKFLYKITGFNHCSITASCTSL